VFGQTTLGTRFGSSNKLPAGHRNCGELLLRLRVHYSFEQTVSGIIEDLNWFGQIIPIQTFRLHLGSC